MRWRRHPDLSNNAGRRRSVTLHERQMGDSRGRPPVGKTVDRYRPVLQSVQRLQRPGSPEKSAAGADSYYGDESRGATVAQLRQIFSWSSQHNWVERVNDFDIRFEIQQLNENIELSREMTCRHAGLATQFQRAALEALEGMHLKDIGASDAIRTFEVAVRIERLARGEATERQELSGINGGPIAVEKQVLVPDVERLAKITAALLDAGIGVDEGLRQPRREMG